MSASQQKVDRNTNLLNKSVSMCDAFQEEYDLAKASRNEEIELIETIRKMVNYRLSQFSGTSVDEWSGDSASEYQGEMTMVGGGNARDRNAEWES